MSHTELSISGNPGIVLARVAPALLRLLGPDGLVLGGGTVLAARWQHRVSTDIDLFIEAERYRDRVASRRDEVVATLSRLVSEIGEGEKAAIASEMRSLPSRWSGGQPVREPAYPDLLRNLARRARHLFESGPDTIGQSDLEP